MTTPPPPRRPLSDADCQTLRLFAGLFAATFLVMGIQVLVTGVDGGTTRRSPHLVISTGVTARWMGAGYLSVAALFLTGVTPATRLIRAMRVWLVSCGLMIAVAFVMAIRTARESQAIENGQDTFRPRHTITTP